MDSFDNDITTKNILNNNKMALNENEKIIPALQNKKRDERSHTNKETPIIRYEFIDLKLDLGDKKPKKNKISLSYLSNNKQDLIKNYICTNCNVILTRVYVVDLEQCGHFFCFGCLLQLFSKGEKFVYCPKCYTVFYRADIKLDLITTRYLQSFLPKYNRQRKINYFPNDKRYYLKSIKFKAIPANMPKRFELPEIHYPFNKFKIYILDEYYDIVSELKNRIFNGLILSKCRNIKDISLEEIEIRINNNIVTDFPFYKTFQEFDIELPPKCNVEYCLK